MIHVFSFAKVSIKPCLVESTLRASFGREAAGNPKSAEFKRLPEVLSTGKSDGVQARNQGKIKRRWESYRRTRWPKKARD